MKQYQKVYEDVYTGERTLTKCKLEKVGTDIGLNGLEYRKLFHNHLVKFENVFFEYFIKSAWLKRRFCYNGQERKKKMWNGNYLDNAYGIFLRNYVGMESFLFSVSGVYSFLQSYIKDFFPDFDARDILQEKIEYPYKYMHFGHLFVVYQMAERLELLEYGEKNKMDYAHFIDYVINYALCFNDEKGEEWYRPGDSFFNKRLYIINIKGERPNDE